MAITSELSCCEQVSKCHQILDSLSVPHRDADGVQLHNLNDRLMLYLSLQQSAWASALDFVKLAMPKIEEVEAEIREEP